MATKTPTKPNTRKWIQTFSGGIFFPLTPRVCDVRLEDIAHSLSTKCRFTGHCRDLYSVAQHSCRMLDVLGKIIDQPTVAWHRAILFHDAAEAYLPDIASPYKEDIVGFADIEDRVLRVICQAQGVDINLIYSNERLLADRIMLHWEKRDQMKPCDYDWALKDIPDGILDSLPPIRTWTPTESEQRFLWLAEQTA